MSETHCYDEIVTSNGGKKIYFNGYTYQKYNTYKDKHYWVCEMREKFNCQVTVKTIYNETTGLHMHLNESSEGHTHEPDVTRQTVANIVRKIKNEALSKLHIPAAQIIREKISELSANCPEVLPKLPSVQSIKQSIIRARKKTINEIDIQNRKRKS